MSKIFFYNLIIISFFLASCSTEEDTTTTTTTTTYPTSFSGDDAFGPLTVGSSTLSGTHKTVCAEASDMSHFPTDANSVGSIILVTGDTTFTKEYNFYTDSACTLLSLGWYFNYDNATLGDA